VIAYAHSHQAFRTVDGAFLLSYSAVMLNVDAHNPNLVRYHTRVQSHEPEPEILHTRFARNNQSVVVLYV
jgi:hypothetical protein